MCERVIISLTTIPPRMKMLEPMLKSLLEQTAKIDSINLYIPNQYQRAEFADYDLSEIPKEFNVIMVDTDYGPATKILPAVKQYAGQDIRIIFCDDDRMYDKEWAARLLAESRRHPDDCITEWGVTTRIIEAHKRWDRKGLIYRLGRAASLGMWKPTRYIRGKHVDMFEGFGGVLVKPRFFSESAFDIPDILWTVDDIWLSGNLTVNNVTITMTSGRPGTLPNEAFTEASPIDALYLLTYKNHDRTAANSACMDYYRKNYGIW